MNDNFTIRDLKKLGADRTPSLDFSDDGTRFKMFTFNGLPISFAKADDIFFISIRFDYVDGLRFDECRNWESQKVVNEFNGVEEVNIQKLKENLEFCLEELTTWQNK